MVGHTRRRGSIVLLTALMVVPMGLAAPRALAATCQSVPGSTPATDIRLAGQDRHIPAIANIRVCVDSASAPMLTADLAGHGNCLSPCLSILLVGNDADAGAFTLSYTEDGVTRVQTVDPDSVDVPEGGCLLSVGSPKAPYPTCLNAFGTDLGDAVGDVTDLVAGTVPIVWGAVGTVTTTVNGVRATAEAIAADAAADALALAGDALVIVDDTLQPARDLVDRVNEIGDDPCAAIAPQEDPNDWQDGEVGFCEDPITWTQLAVWDLCARRNCAVQPDEVVELAREVFCRVQPDSPSCWDQ